MNLASPTSSKGMHPQKPEEMAKAISSRFLGDPVVRNIKNDRDLSYVFKVNASRLAQYHNLMKQVLHGDVERKDVKKALDQTKAIEEIAKKIIPRIDKAFEVTSEEDIKANKILVDMLAALQEQYDNVHYLRNQIHVTCRDHVILEETYDGVEYPVDLGKWIISIEIKQAGLSVSRPKAKQVPGTETHARGDASIYHPYVATDGVCLGPQGEAYRRAYRERDILSCFDIVRGLLYHWTPQSNPHAPLQRFIKTDCNTCKKTEYVESLEVCPKCKERICVDCCIGYYAENLVIKHCCPSCFDQIKGSIRIKGLQSTLMVWEKNLTVTTELIPAGEVRDAYKKQAEKFIADIKAEITKLEGATING